MNRFHSLALVGALSVTAGTVMAASGSLSPFRPHVLPVLVQVDASGKVTNASPAVELSPAISRLLAKNLDEMITKPAYDHGRPVASQFVMNLALQAMPRDEGNYDAQFVYVSTTPVPTGTWHWVNIDGRRFALAGPNDRYMRGHVPFDHPSYEPPHFNNFQQSSSSGAQSAMHNTSGRGTTTGR